MERLYVAQGVNGLLKAGKTSNKTNRVYRLRNEFKSKGDVLGRLVFCDDLKETGDVEWQMHAQLRQTCPLHSGREWYASGDFDEALAIARAYTAEANEKT